jgi:transposase
MGHIEGASGEQSILFPEVLDDYVTADNPVRFMEAFVEGLALDALGFQRAQPAATGRPAYCPGDLLKLYIYGYVNRLRSSRRLEQEAHRNVEVIWLLRHLRPDFKTIADFRKDNIMAFKQVFRRFTLLCKELDLFGGELLAIDGSKFKAVTSKPRNLTNAKLQEALKHIDAQLEHYLHALKTTDQEEADVQKPTAEELQEKIGQLKERQSRYKGLKVEMEAREERQVSLTDPDSRAMPKSPKVDVGYNVQVAVDAKHHLMVAQEVTNAITDVDQLSRMAIQAKEALGVE